MRNHLFMIGLAALFACNNAPKTGADSDSSATDTTATMAVDTISGTSCYVKATGKDTFYLQLIINKDQVAGQLDYNFFEKDKSTGTITGTLKDNILRASYSYQAEGMNNHRPVVFKLENGQVFEALADKFDAMGVPEFSTSDTQLKFDPAPYKKQDCK